MIYHIFVALSYMNSANANEIPGDSLYCRNDIV
jgi:hypothetical protein